MRHRLRGLLGVLVVLGALGLPAVGTAAAAGTASAPPGPAIDALPFSASGGATASSAFGGPGSESLNAAVSAACHGGQPLGGAQWLTLPTGDLGSIYVIGRGVYYPRSMTELRSAAVAVVDHETDTVLRCGSAPVQVTAAHAAAVVLYFDPAELATCRANNYCQDPQTSLHVNRSEGPPSNDTMAQARPVASLPFTDTVDTAFADDDGPSMFDLQCRVSMINPRQVKTAWWSWTATASGTLPLAVDVERYGPPGLARTFPAEVGLLLQTPSGPVRVSRRTDTGCENGPFRVEAGQSYLIGVAMVDPGYYGGPLVEGGHVRLHVGSVDGPGAPVGLQATDIRPGDVQLTWQAPPSLAPVEAYEVTRDGSAADGTGPTTVRVPGTARSHTFTGLRPGATYGYSVRAVTAAGVGVPATAVKTVGLPGRPLTSPVQSDIGGRSATLTWQPPPPDGALPITGYRVSRDGVDDGGGGPWSTVVSATTRSFTFTQLRLAVRYELSVEAINVAGTGPSASRPAQVGNIAGSPKTVIATSDAETRSATLSWSPPDDDGGLPITGYRVARDGDDSGGTGPWSTIVPATARSQSFTYLLLGKTYTLSVQAITEAGTGHTERATTTVTPTPWSGYAELNPLRVLDTRTGVGTVRAAKLGPGETLTVYVTGSPGTGYAPLDSTAVVLNVTATGATDVGYVSVYPPGFPDGPASSNLNVAAGRTVPNLVVSKVSPRGGVTFYNHAGTVDLVVDLQGAFSPSFSPTYLPMDPQRMLDTRTGLGSGTAAKVGPGGTLRLQVVGPGLAPAGTRAVALNITATNPTATGYVSVYPTGFAAGPNSSNLNVEPGETAPNLVVSKVASDGSVTLYNSSGTVDLIADLQGAYVGAFADRKGFLYRPTNPRRVLDTRDGLGVPTAGAVGPRGTVVLKVTGEPGSGLAPIGSTAVVLNVTATNPTAVGYVSVYPTGSAAGPDSSNLNVVPGRTVPNLVMSKVAADGTVTLYNANGTVDLIADLQGSYSSGAAGTSSAAPPRTAATTG